jgi:poly-beta-hydroxyalkanoate depolymerase
MRALGPCVNAEATSALRNVAAACELITRASLSHARPAYGIDSVRIGNRDMAVTEEPVDASPFGTLLHFKKDVATPQPCVLVVAPLSGHFPTLLRGLVRTMLPDHDVCITDWPNARDVGIAHGRFGCDRPAPQGTPEALLAKGRLSYQGRPVDPKAIRRTALLTVEGERDDICAIGQPRRRPICALASSPT